jgi:hypothetical protein
MLVVRNLPMKLEVKGLEVRTVPGTVLDHECYPQLVERADALPLVHATGVPRTA